VRTTAVPSTRILAEDIATQADKVAAALGPLRAQVAGFGLGLGPDVQVTVTGSGDSLIAGQALGRLGSERFPRRWRVLAPTNVCTADDHRPGDLLVVISFSGSGARTVEAARRARDRGVQTVAVTNDRDSPLASHCDAVLHIPEQGPSRSIPHATDFTLTLLALACLLEVDGRHLGALDGVSTAMTATADSVAAYRSQVVASLREAGRAVFLGAGDAAGLAAYGAAKWWEAGGLPAWASDPEEFGHGMHLLVRPGDVVFLLTDGFDAADVEGVLAGLRTLRVNAWTIGARSRPERHLPTVVVDDRLRAFTGAVPLQLACQWLAEERSLDVAAPPVAVDAPLSYQRYRDVVAAAAGSSRDA
jgi:fructoselysine-6-P-deglycase FrlB-like protein